jgi:deazaflavin-dependent oxidoreductase (nitroreductase family)
LSGFTEYAEANRLQRSMRSFASSGPGSWLFARAAHRLDKPIFRLTRGRYTLGRLVSGIPIVMLTTVGARSGVERTVPVLGLPSSVGLAVIASNFGQKRHPGWYHNIRANPEVTVAVDGRSWQARAVPVEGPDREVIWEEGLRVYPGWTQYEGRASNRRIAVFVLEPL